MSRREKFYLASSSSDSLIEYLASRDIQFSTDADIRFLTGGVSGAVVRVTDSSHDVIVKQAFARLAVPDEWLANPRRALTEARGLSLLSDLLPDRGPEIIDVDETEYVIVMEAAPDSWEAWKERLLQTDLSPDDIAVGGALGEALSQWHAKTSAPEILSRFHADDDFRALRSKPFYVDLAKKHPSLLGRLEELANSLHANPTCVIHGDFSPKNILVGPESKFWILDFETAVASQPVFDVAFMLMHLTLKSLVRGKAGAADIATAFLDRYTATGAAFAIGGEGPLAHHLAVLCLARVDGVSKVDYLSDEAAEFVRNLAVATLLRERPTVEEMWQEIDLWRVSQS